MRELEVRMRKCWLSGAQQGNHLWQVSKNAFHYATNDNARDYLLHASHLVGGDPGNALMLVVWHFRHVREDVSAMRSNPRC